MASYRQTNAGGTNGSTLTAGSGGSTDGSTPYDAVSVGVNATLAYDNTHSLFGTGDLAVKCATGVSSVTDYMSWSTSLAFATPMYCSQCFYFTAAPAAQIRLLSILAAGTAIAKVNLTAAGKFQLSDAAANVQATTGVVPTNAPFRIDLALLALSATVGQMELRYFADPFSSIPTESVSPAATWNSGTTAPDEIRFGLSAGLANVVAFWMDEAQASNTAYPPPPRWTRSPLNRPSSRAPLIRAGSW